MKYKKKPYLLYRQTKELLGCVSLVQLTCSKAVFEDTTADRHIYKYFVKNSIEVDLLIVISKYLTNPA